jgi:hypothetical protein
MVVGDILLKPFVSSQQKEKVPKLYCLVGREEGKGGREGINTSTNWMNHRIKHCANPLVDEKGVYIMRNTGNCPW